MTLLEVSASTKIAVSKLQAIERDEIESLPGGIFTRGFVRSYAAAVGLDPQDTLAKFEARFPDESSVATLHATIAGRANEEFVRRQRTAKGVIWFALLLVLPLVVWLLAVVSPDDPPGGGGWGGSRSRRACEPARVRTVTGVVAGAAIRAAGRAWRTCGAAAGCTGGPRAAHNGDRPDGGLLGAGLR